METGLRQTTMAKAGSLTGHLYLSDENIKLILDYFKWFLDAGYKPAGGSVFIYIDPYAGQRLFISVYLLFQEKNWLERLLGL